MIHIATVHFKTDMWVDLQLRRLAAHLDRPYRVHAYLEGDAAAHADRFDEPLIAEKMPHWQKLDDLASRICAEADADDVLLFLDGDAFPVADLGEGLDRMLSAHQLAAIRRPENCGDLFPHPSFCATTARFWRQSEATWVAGYRVADCRGELVTDTGANLLKLLEDRQVDWLPLSRTNVRNLHPVLFGVYDDLIYHHGAGFRRTLTRVDMIEVEEEARRQSPDGEVPEELLAGLTHEHQHRNIDLTMSVYREALADDEFWRRLFY
jgi:hypothetical protein